MLKTDYLEFTWKRLHPYLKMVPLDSSQPHEHEGGLGFLIGEGLSMFVCVCPYVEEEEEELGERERETESDKKWGKEGGNPGREREGMSVCGPTTPHNTKLHVK